MTSTCAIKINNCVIPYEVINFSWKSPNPWDIYLNHLNRNLIVCNISLLKNKTIILEYKFNTSIETSLFDVDYQDFQYDTETAEVWNGNTSERIEFRVFGQ